VRLRVWVTAGAHQTEVGGRYGDSEPPVLQVRVTSPAHNGAANRAVIAALAKALGVPASALRMISGSSSRTKLIEVNGQLDPGRIEDLFLRKDHRYHSPRSPSG
jgi:uncharacterized protein